MSIYGLLYEDADRISSTIPTVKAVVPVKSMQQPARYGKQELDFLVVVTTEEWFELVERDVIAGRVLLKRDIKDVASVAVLTEYGARRLLATATAIGTGIRIGGNTYEV